MRVYGVVRRRKPDHDDLLDEREIPINTVTALARLGVDEASRTAYLRAQKDLKEAAKALRQALKTKNDAQIAAALETFQAATARDSEAWGKVLPFIHAE